MKIKNEGNWQKVIEAQHGDAYGLGVVTFAERWADLMEEEMAHGHEIPDIAQDASHRADTEGITGFMYGCAVSLLAQNWEYGDGLRRWHNLKTQIRDEGERANESGGVLNPALLNINIKD